MSKPPIISRTESLRILRNMLTEAALKKEEANLRSATEGERSKIIAQINEQVDKEIKERRQKEPWNFLHF